MRVLKKPKKNPTFNEYFPQRIAIDETSSIFYMFDYVFNDNELQIKIANLFEDIPILKLAQTAATNIISKDPKLQKEENSKLRELIKDKFSDRIEI